VPVEIRFVHADWLIGEVDRSSLPAAAALQEWVRRAPRPGVNPARPSQAHRVSQGAYG
jgi:hypothetical protein